MATGLSAFGAFHTLIGLIAVAAGVLAFIRSGGISWRTRPGQVYVVMTVVTCLTGFFIFRHGDFGKPHALGVLTLLALVAAAAAARQWFGRASAYIETAAFTSTFFFHLVPAITESGTRLPAAAPLFASPEDPLLQTVIAPVFLAFLVGLTVQLMRLRASRRTGSPAGSQVA